MPKAWEDKSQWISNCPICYCAVTHQLRDYHIQYHENQSAISEIVGGREGIDGTRPLQYTQYMKEPKIMKMDWRSLGYWPVYKDGKLTWEKDPDERTTV